jgi:rod shape-determining protein MreC
MIRFLRDRKGPFLLILVLLGLLALMSAQVRTGGSTMMEQALFRLASPVVGLSFGAVELVRGGWENYVYLIGVRGENQKLTDRMHGLGVAQARMDEIARENRRLRELLGLQARLGVPSLAAKVISNQGEAPERTILLDRGRTDRIARDLPVVTEAGVVGRILSVGPKLSKVQLITDGGSAVAVRIVRTRLQGILAGRGGPTLRLRYVPDLEDVRIGDRLVTSGLDQIYPDGYPVGYVVHVESGSGAMKEIQVAPAVNFARLEEVILLLSRAPMAPAGAAGDGQVGLVGEAAGSPVP